MGYTSRTVGPSTACLEEAMPMLEGSEVMSMGFAPSKQMEGAHDAGGPEHGRVGEGVNHIQME